MDIPESYGLSWPGKADAAARAQLPPKGSLTIDEDEGVHDQASRNVFVEGDNLDALKLLMPDLEGLVDLIYIDPPYNTGNRFTYEDARTQSDWLNMMYPRLILGASTLKPGGVGMVSIDSNQLAHLRLMLEEIVGPANVFATIAWVSNLKGRQIGAGGPVGTHEYIVCFARDASLIPQFRADAEDLHDLMPALYRQTRRQIRSDEHGEYVCKNQLYNTNSKFNEHTAPTMVYTIHYDPATGDIRLTDVGDPRRFDGYLVAEPHPNARPEAEWHAWRWSRTKVLEDRHDLEFEVTDDGQLRIWTKIRDTAGMALKDVVLGPSTVTGQRDLADLGLARAFETPKPVALLSTLIRAAAPADATVLDFFAGSGSTGHAVMAANAQDGGSRRFVLVQSPEPTSAGGTARHLGFETIAQLARERLRRSAAKIGDSGDFQALKVGS